MELMTNYVKKAGLSFAMLALVAMVLPACGSGTGGNNISGSAIYNDGSAARANWLVAGDEPMTGVLVQLVDINGDVVAETYVDSNGNFSFGGVAEGDYTLRFVDPDTDEVITEVDVSIMEGDDAKLTGSFNDNQATWEIEFDSNDGDSSLNETQQERAAKIGDLAGIPASEVEAMRLSGMGWGQIAHELGLHPGHLGMGHPDGWDPKKTRSAKNAGRKDKGNGKPDNPGKGNNGNGNGHGNK
ncbi:MAG: carboxypeptidase regulatory-like domain-containing protein [Nitrospinota bacterium]|nr:carboxypeptidase regulatory-like domain-containing protein [Nitrospinota bacterium]